jgi:hypothetical protein
VVELGVDEERTARQRASLEEAATAEGAAKDSITHASPRGLRARALNQPIIQKRYDLKTGAHHATNTWGTLQYVEHRI